MHHLLLAALLCLALACSDPQRQVTQAEMLPTGAFLGIVPTDTPTMVAPGFISTQLGEYNGTFNPDGTEFFYTVSVPGYNRIVFTALQDDRTWSPPAFASFSSTYEEWDPIFAPGGQRLWYNSHRPVNDTGNSDHCNLWYVDRIDTGWSTPVYVPLSGPAPGNYYGSATDSGIIYFNIWATGDLFRGLPSDTGYLVEPVPEIMESQAGDGDPFVAPDESYLIWRSYRDGGLGDGDLWISFQVAGAWTSPQNLGEPINSRYREMCPYVTADGELLIFASNRFATGYYDTPPQSISDVMAKQNSQDNGQQNIYAISASFIETMRKQLIAGKQ